MFFLYIPTPVLYCIIFSSSVFLILVVIINLSRIIPMSALFSVLEAPVAKTSSLCVYTCLALMLFLTSDFAFSYTQLFVGYFIT